MAGYSGTPLPRKLIKPGHRVALLGSPPAFTKTLGAVPEGVTVRTSAKGAHTIDVVVLFAKGLADLAKHFSGAAEALTYDGGLWVAWPKKASGVRTDLTEDAVRARGLSAGLVDNKVCAIDDVWSALRFVHRVENRPKARPR